MRKETDMRGKLTKALLAKVDWDALQKELEATVGTKFTEFRHEYHPRRDHNGTNWGTLDLCTNDLVLESGVFSTSLNHVYVANFNTEYVKDERRLWITFVLHIELLSGGSNGISLPFDAYWSFKTKSWDFVVRHRKG